MRRLVRSTNPLWMTLLATAAVVAVLLAMPGAGSYAAWNGSAPLGGTVTTGSLSIDEDTLTAGAWTKDGASFDPAADTFAAGTTLTSTVSDVPVTAVGDNLKATFALTGAQLPDSVKDHVDVAVTSDPVLGAESGPDGHQTVDLTLTVTADAGLPSGAEALDLTALTVTLSNGHGWSDAATLDAGSISTADSTAPGGKVDLQFNLEHDADKVVGFYLQDPAPGTQIRWNLWNTDGTEVVTDAVDGLNSMDYGSGSATPFIEIVGGFGGFGSPDQTEELIGALTDVQGWTDDIGSMSARYAFMNASHLKYVASLPNGITDASYAFKNAGTEADQLYLASWTAENATSLAHMFDGASSFNEKNITLDTAKVTDMSYMFAGATSFPGPVSFTTTSNVHTMEGMFLDATAYVGNTWEEGSYIQFWDVSNVTNMARMFEGATSFNRRLDGWDVSMVGNMSAMFKGASAFNQNLERWNTSNVTNMSAMFQDATAFNQNINTNGSAWNVSKVTTMAHMFDGAVTFNGDLSAWETGHAEDMSAMFKGAVNFNGNIGGWKTQKVVTMQEMFHGATAFSQDLSRWNVSKVDNHTDFATGAGSLTEPKWKGALASPVRPSARPAGGTTDVDGQSADRPSDTTDPASDPASDPTIGTTAEATTEPGAEDAGTDGSKGDAAPEKTPPSEDPVDADQAVAALEDAWKHAQESATDESRQALADAAKAVDAVLGEGTADELVQRLEDEAVATPSVRPTPAPEAERAD